MNTTRNAVNGQYASKGIENVKQWVTKSNPDMEYIGGFTNFDSLVEVRCKKCGSVFSRSMVTIRHGRKIQCYSCREIERKAKEEKRLEDIQKARQKRREQAEINRKVRAEELKEQRKLNREANRHDCPVCGTSTTRRKYCSDECARKAGNHQRDVKRRHTIDSVMVDRDITLEGLFRRDGGRCWICGMPCYYTDIVVTDKTKVAGNMYPSIDHVKPLAEGGEHSWKNVKLAHRICNSDRANPLRGRKRKMTA